MTHASPSLRIALALGGGGARGLAHIVILEALDELGLRPSAIAGTSIGAIVGAAYAAGVSGKDLRAYALSRLRNRAQVMSRVLQARVGKLTDLFSGLGNPVLVDGEKLLDLFWPEAVPDSIEDLAIPFQAVATDYFGRCEHRFGAGPLVTAVAASMAIPGLVRPVLAAGRTFIDGGAVNPLPFEGMGGAGVLVIAVDVTGGPANEAKAAPEAFEAMLGASQIMQGAIVAEKLKARAPDILVRPAVDGFRGLDFFRAKAILQAAEPAKEQFKRDLDAALAPNRVSGARRKTT
jgi:NTE family protein